MIPETHITIKGGMAWWVKSIFDSDFPASRLAELDRPCDMCDPKAWIPRKPDLPCGDCDGTGRHRFEVEVSCFEQHRPDALTICEHEHTHRVSVVPGMVLPIVDVWGDPDSLPSSGLVVDIGGKSAPWVTDIVNRDERTLRPVTQVTLPPAAKPGMWAVQLKVHA